MMISMTVCTQHFTFVQWTPTGIKTTRYTLNESMWNEMKEAGLKFYDLHQNHFRLMKKQLYDQTNDKKRKLETEDDVEEGL